MAANNNLNLEEDMISNSAKKISSSDGATSIDDGDVVIHTASVSQEIPMVPTTSASSGVGQPRVDLGNKGSTLAPQDGSSASRSSTSSEDYRIQVRLENGNFTSALKNALLRDLNSCLYSSPSRSFVPSFSGSGLRFGAIWFAPDNDESCTWLKQKLASINENAGDFKFRIEPFALHQSKVSINIPWDPRENLKHVDILRRLRYQNPSIPMEHWRVVRTKLIGNENQLVICCIDDFSLKLLKKNHFRINYAFDKVFVKTLQQNQSVKPKS